MTKMNIRHWRISDKTERGAADAMCSVCVGRLTLVKSIEMCFKLGAGVLPKICGVYQVCGGIGKDGG